MSYTEAQKKSIYRWRENNKEAWRELQRQNARKWYEKNKEAKLASMREKRLSLKTGLLGGGSSLNGGGVLGGVLGGGVDTFDTDVHPLSLVETHT